MFSFLKKNIDFFAPHEKQVIVEAVRNAEKRTSGEIRVFVETHCRYVDAMDRAREIFDQLKMDQTKDRNAVLLYMAVKDRQLAVLGDEGIHQKVGDGYWNTEVMKMVKTFNQDNYADGLVICVKDIGEALHAHFPYDSKIDKNELPDDIVFGR
jgi:uncharacterized membrane protein